MASPSPQEKDCILIDAHEDHHKSLIKLKFKCLEGVRRDEALTAFSERVTAVHGLPIGNRLGLAQQQYPTFLQCQRLTRRNGGAGSGAGSGGAGAGRVESVLMCAPYGLMELDPATGMPIRMYYYRCIRGISFTRDDENGIVFHISETNANSSTDSSAYHHQQQQVKTECKVWFVFSQRLGGSGRSELVTILKNKFELFALPMVISESIELGHVMHSKACRSQKSQVGERMGVFPIQKFTERAKMNMKMKLDSSSQTGVGAATNVNANANIGACEMYLVTTRNGFLLEMEVFENGIQSAKSCRPLQDIANIIRHGDPTDGTGTGTKGGKFTLEYKGGLRRTYASMDRDAVIVPILDAAVNLCRNFNLTVADFRYSPYRMIGFAGADDEMNLASSAQSAPNLVFHQEPIDIQCLKKLHGVSSVSFAVMEHLYHLDKTTTVQKMIGEIVATVECCREFNANVSIQTACAIVNEKKFIEESINALWGISSILMNYIGNADASGTNAAEDDTNRSIHGTIVPIFQTLYRLMLTENGYSSTARNEDALNSLLEIWRIKDSFALYWALKCLSALLLPRPFSKERDKRNEFSNKGLLLHSNSNVVKELVRCMIGSGIQEGDDSSSSALVSMVCINIVESLLCSHRDTTTPNQFATFIEILSTE